MAMFKSSLIGEKGFHIVHYLKLTECCSIVLGSLEMQSLAEVTENIVAYCCSLEFLCVSKELRWATNLCKLMSPNPGNGEVYRAFFLI